jgi:tetratricopeptide (TPR) repeat protein
MHRLLVAVALLTGCRGDRDHAAPAPSPQPATSAPAADLPKLPSSPDGVAELRVIDADIERLRSDAPDRASFVNLLLGRAALTQAITDYTEAVSVTQAWVEAAPAELAAWKARAQTLAHVHRFAEARAALEHVKTLGGNGEWEDLAATLDEATGHPELAAPLREQRAGLLVRPEVVTMLGVNLALRGKVTEAIALIPKAVAAAHDNSPVNFAWVYFQWGRFYEQAGQLAKARDLFAEAHRRMPGYLEAIIHLAQTMTATGQDPTALVADALHTNQHPDLLALAGKTAEAKAGWERYLTALPEAFSDHAARFYLGPGADPVRALVLAKANLANRDTTEARSLAADAALAAGDPAEACRLVEPLLDPARGALRAQQFTAWRALSACGRKTDADRVAASLGIH